MNRALKVLIAVLIIGFIFVISAVIWLGFPASESFDPLPIIKTLITIGSLAMFVGVMGIITTLLPID